MGLLTNLLLFPVTGPIHGLRFILEQLREEAEAVLWDENRVQAQLMNLSLQHDLGEMTDEEYDEREAELLEELNAIRAYKEELLEYQAHLESSEE